MIACRSCEREFKYYSQRLRHEAKAHNTTVGGANMPPTGVQPEPERIDLGDSTDYAGVNARFSALPPQQPPEPPNDDDATTDPQPPPVDTDAIRAAFSVDMLAELLKGVSALISDLDGAGAAGTFSPMEAKQIAYLIYDPIIDTIATKFGGNVGRFKMTIAVAIIVLGKGRVHFNAIRAKRSKPKPPPDTVEQDNSAPTSTEPDPQPTSPEPEPEQYDAPVDFAALARLQKESNEDD